MTSCRQLSNLKTLKLSWNHWQLHSKRLEGLEAVASKLRELVLEGFSVSLFEMPASSSLEHLSLGCCEIKVGFFQSLFLQSVRHITLLGLNHYDHHDVGNVASLTAALVALPKLQRVAMRVAMDGEKLSEQPSLELHEELTPDAVRGYALGKFAVDEI